MQPQQKWGQRFAHVTLTGMGSNLILQWLQKYVIAKAGETRGSRTALFVKHEVSGDEANLE